MDELQKAIRATEAGEPGHLGLAYGHQAPVLGMVAGLHGLAPRVLTTAFLYTFSRDLLSAAVRLGLVGPLRAVSMQRELQPLCLQLLDECEEWGSGSDPTQTEPLVELMQANHQLLYSRLFVS
eukprot:COSAG01_NODE_2439_length_7691_cov_15.896470_2_plen_123_part_00